MPNNKGRGKRVVPRKKLVLESARRGADFLETVMARAAGLIIVLDRRGRVVKFNKACEKLTGYKAKELLGKPFWDYLILPEEIAGVKKEFSKLRAGKPTGGYVNYWKAKDGSKHLTAWSNGYGTDARGEAQYVIGTGMDITEQRRAEEELKQSRNNLEALVQGRTSEIRSVNKKLREEIETRARAQEDLLAANKIMSSIFETTHFNVALFDRNFNFLFVNRSYAEQCALPAKKMIGKNFFQLFPAPEVEKLYRKVLRAGKPYSLYAMPYDFPTQPKRGTTYWDWTLHPLFGPGGKVDRLLITSVEVTEQKKAQLELRQSEHKYRFLIENAQEGIMTLNRERAITLVNRRMAEILGYRIEDMVGQSMFRFVDPKDLEMLKTRMEKRARGEEEIYELRYRHKDGAVVWGRVHGSPVRDERGKVTGAFGFVSDITAQKKAELKIKKMNSLLAAAKDIAQALLAAADESALYQKICDACLRVPFIKFSWIGLVVPGGFEVKPVAASGFEDGYLSSIKVRWDDSPAGNGPTGTCIKTRKTFLMTGMDTDPRYRPWREQAAKRGYRASLSLPLIHKHETLGALMVYSEDREAFEPEVVELLEEVGRSIAIGIKSLRAEQELAESERRMSQFIEGMPAALYVVDSEGRPIYESKSSRELLRKSIGAIDSQAAKTALAPQDQTFLAGTDRFYPPERTPIRRALKGESSTVDDAEVRFPDKIVPLEISSAPIFDDQGKVRYAVSIFRDITERKRMETQLQQALNHWKKTFDAIGDHICLLDRDGTILQCNESMVALLNLPQDKIVGQKCHKLMHNSDRFSHGCPYLKMMKSGKRESFELASGDNYFLVSADPVLDDQGEIAGAVHIMRDITEHRRDQDALAREKELLAVTLRSIGDGLIATDIRGTIILFNRVAEELTGWPQDEAQGRSLERVMQLVDRKTGAGAWNSIQESARNGVIIGAAGNVGLLTRNRGERSISYSSAPILDRESNIIGAVVAFSDITDQERMEQELLKTEKLESLGVLAGGIAHDFNNILTAILGNISLVKMNFAQESEEFVDLSDAETACHRARDLARQLLTFSKGDAPLTRPTAITGLIKESAAFILAGSKAKLDLVLADGLWPVEADSGQISQVIHNLVLNADQAMPGGGTIKVSAENILVEPHEQLLMLPGKHVRISVSDHGVGIPEPNLKKIFDPFFTTKEKGNGLGLSVVYSIIKKHRGHIEVKSEVGAGSTFLVYLPASEKDASGKEPDARLIVGKGLVLVMDDEEKVREVAGRMLWRLGYETVLARDGVEAIQLYRQSLDSGQGFDAVIMDLTIPGGMGGKEAVQKILELDPSARVIASSGYFTDPVMTDHQQYGFLDCIAKPYAIKEMSRVLARVLKNRS